MLAADVMSIEQWKSVIIADQNGTDLAVKWHEINNREFEFIIDSIQRKEADTEININWNGKEIGIDNKGNNSLIIPGRNNFAIVGVDVVQSPDQYLEINFSDPLKKRQNFKGLVTIQNGG